MKTYISFLLVSFCLLTCKKSSQISNIPSDYHLGDTFALKTNECAKLTPFLSTYENDSTLTICFENILKDERCYKSVCYICYASFADIQISMVHQNDTSLIPLTVIGCSGEPVCDEHYYYRKDTLGYRICLLRLDPYPDTDNTPINLPDYTAKLKITKP